MLQSRGQDSCAMAGVRAVFVKFVVGGLEANVSGPSDAVFRRFHLAALLRLSRATWLFVCTDCSLPSELLACLGEGAHSGGGERKRQGDGAGEGRGGGVGGVQKGVGGVGGAEGWAGGSTWKHALMRPRVSDMCASKTCCPQGCCLGGIMAVGGACKESK